MERRRRHGEFTGSHTVSALRNLTVASAQLGLKETALAASEEAVALTDERSPERGGLLRLRSDVLLRFGDGPAAIDLLRGEA